MAETSVFWLNLNVDTAGVWIRDPEVGRLVGAQIFQQVGGADIEILEVKVSGGAVLFMQGSAIAPVGGPDVFLTIDYTSGLSERRSAPCDRPYKLSKVEDFSLNVYVPVGNDAYEQVAYTIWASAHCQWSGPRNLANLPPNG
jgi:hypothetical protein